MHLAGIERRVLLLHDRAPVRRLSELMLVTHHSNGFCLHDEDLRGLTISFADACNGSSYSIRRTMHYLLQQATCLSLRSCASGRATYDWYVAAAGNVCKR